MGGGRWRESNFADRTQKFDRVVIMVVCEVTDLHSKNSEVKRRIIWRGISQNTTLVSESENLEGTRGQAGTYNLRGKRPFNFSLNYWS